jgi:hypothetical protein
MKAAIKAVIKLTLTPPFVCIVMLFILAIYAIQCYEWLYDCDQLDRDITSAMLQDYYDLFKKWFTKL